MALHWIAAHLDGSVMAERDGATYAQLDRANLRSFCLFDETRLVLEVDLRPDDLSNGIEPRRLIYRQRTMITSTGLNQSVYLVGWQRKVNGLNVQAICYVTETGAILLGGQFTGREFMDGIYIQQFEQDLI